MLSAGSCTAASTLYMAVPDVSGTNTAFYTVDQTTASATSIGSFGRCDIDDLASDWRPGSFRLWGVDETSDQLYQINPATGLPTLIAPLSTHINSIAFDVTTGQLFGTTGPVLYRIDPTTAALTSVGITNRADVRSIGFDLAGNLYGSASGSLVKLNTSTGAATVVGAFGAGATSIYDFAARPEDGVMFAVGDPFASVLYQIDTATGHATLVAGIGSSTTIINTAYGLAFSPAVPEPSTLSLIAAAASLALCRRSKHPVR